MKNLILLFVVLIWSCTPKVTEKVATDTKPDPVVEIDPNDPCRTWNNLPNKDEIIESHVLYRDFLKQGDYDQAYILWKVVFEAAPMADGRRTTHFEDGVQLNHHFYHKETDTIKKAEFKRVILEDLYPDMNACAKDKGEAAGLQAYDLYYNYPGLASDQQIYDLFKKSIDATGQKTKAFVLNPFTKLLTDLHLAGITDMQEAQVYASKIQDALAYGPANCGTNCESWKVVQGYVPGQLDRLESIKGFYDCDYYRTKYYAEFVADQQNCEVIDAAYIRMKWGDCPINDPQLSEVSLAKQNLCKEAVVGDVDLVEGRDCLENGKYKCAMDAYERYVNNSTDPEKKAIYSLRMAKIAYAYLKDYPKARKYALKAASFKSNWGDPYMLIGNLYASSGPLCGPGTGWDSQVVTWVAIDKWQYAKTIDSSVSSSANKLINRYNQYMPTIGDIFQRGMKEGQSFTVPCWINEQTRIRAAKG